MKIKQSLVEQIIKEESLRVKRILVLKEEKENILKQLNELYEEGEMDESIFGDVGKGIKKAFAPKPISIERTIERIKGHQMRKAIYEKFLKENPLKAEKFVEFYTKNPIDAVPSWDEIKQEFVDKSAWGSNDHGFGGGAPEE